MGTHPSTTALYKGSQRTVGKSKDELTGCVIATHQQVLEAHATGHQAWSALLVGDPGQMSFLGGLCSSSLALSACYSMPMHAFSSAVRSL